MHRHGGATTTGAGSGALPSLFGLAGRRRGRQHRQPRIAGWSRGAVLQSSGAVGTLPCQTHFVVPSFFCLFCQFDAESSWARSSRGCAKEAAESKTDRIVLEAAADLAHSGLLPPKCQHICWRFWQCWARAGSAKYHLAKFDGKNVSKACSRWRYSSISAERKTDGEGECVWVF